MRFRRKGADAPGEAHAEQVSDTAGADGSGSSAGPAADEVVARTGPWDADEQHSVDLERVVDLGSLKIAPLDGLDIRLQVDEAANQIASVLLANEEGAVELRPFAAPRSGGLWDEIRPGVREEVERLGGQSEEVDGPHGTELRVVIPLQAPDGQQVVQPSRVFGIEGPRWLIRATMLGRPAVEVEADGPWWEALDSVVVERGVGAMAPGDALPLTMPEGAFADEGDADTEREV